MAAEAGKTLFSFAAGEPPAKVKFFDRMKKLSMSDLNRLSVEDFRRSGKIPLVIVLDNIRSQHNIGSVFRTADAFRVECIHLCGITATPPNREIHKSALGATESVAWKYFGETSQSLQELKDQGYLLYAIEQTNESIPLDKFRPDEGRKMAVIFGNEVNGIDENLLGMVDGAVEIPQSGTKHSLNVSVATGIILWELSRLPSLRSPV
jgi:23S rRNA (guanosine2251-2'-O)-methyltransferase